LLGLCGMLFIAKPESQVQPGVLLAFAAGVAFAPCLEEY
jgi:drug/metabolite transporter (DMT)-like permease